MGGGPHVEFLPSCLGHIKNQQSRVEILSPWLSPGRIPPGRRKIIGVITEQLNSIVDRFMAGDASHLWIVDADVEVPPHALDALIRLDVDVASGIYPEHGSRERLLAYTGTGGSWRPLATDEAAGRVLGEDECVAAGNGCLLVKRRVFKQHHERFTPLRFRWALGARGSDLMFFEDAQDVGFTARLHGGVLCGHLPEWPLEKLR